MKSIGLLRLFSLSANIKLVNVCAGFFTTILLVRLLDSSNFGAYSFFISVLTILIIPSTMGIPEVVLREVSKYNNLNQLKELKLVLYWAKTSVLVCSVIAILILILIYQYYEADNLNVDKSLYLLMALIICIPLSAVNVIRSSILIGMKEPILGQFVDSVVRPLSFLVILFLMSCLVNGYINVVFGLYLYAISLAIAFIIGLYFLSKKIPDLDKVDLNYSFKNTLFLTKSALPLAFISGLYIVSQQIDIILLGFLSTAENLGIYKIAIQLSIFIIFGQQVLRAIIAPKFAALWYESKVRELQKLVLISSRISLMIAFILSIIFYFFGELFLNKFFGEVYLKSYIPMLIICFGQLISAASGSTGLLLNMCGKENQSILGLILGCIVNIIVSILLIPIYGVVGAAIGATTGIIVCNVFLWVAVRKNLNIRPSAFGI